MSHVADPVVQATLHLPLQLLSKVRLFLLAQRPWL
jgi:hypothetical protein